MKAINWIAYVLVIIGGLNWGLVGFFGYNAITAAFGMGTLTAIIYDLVGLSALWMIFVRRSR